MKSENCGVKIYFTFVIQGITSLQTTTVHRDLRLQFAHKKARSSKCLSLYYNIMD